MSNQKYSKILAILSILLFLSILWLPDLALAQTPCGSLAECLKTERITEAWRWVLGLVNIVVILGLILTAFANILRLNIEVYHIKRMLPSIILGVILANFSLLISRIFVDIAQLTGQFMLEGGGFAEVTGQNLMHVFGLPFITIGATGLAAGALAAFGVATGWGIVVLIIGALFILGIPALLIFILALLLAVRNYVVWALVILSPIGFFCLLFTPGQKVWQTWWSWFLKWLFLAPVAFFFLRIAVIVANSGALGQWSDPAVVDPLNNTVADADLPMFGRWFFGIAMFALAFYVPWQLGGAVMGAWANMWKGAMKGARYSGYGIGSAISTWGGKGGKLRKGLGKFGGRLQKLTYHPGMVRELERLPGGRHLAAGVEYFGKDIAKQEQAGGFSRVLRSAAAGSERLVQKNLENEMTSMLSTFSASDIENFVRGQASARAFGFVAADDDKEINDSNMSRHEKAVAVGGRRNLQRMIENQPTAANLEVAQHAFNQAGKPFNQKNYHQWVRTAAVPGITGEPAEPGPPLKTEEMLNNLHRYFGGGLPETDPGLAAKNAEAVEKFITNLDEDAIAGTAQALENIDPRNHLRAVPDAHLNEVRNRALAAGDPTGIAPKIDRLNEARVNYRAERTLPYVAKLQAQIEAGTTDIGTVHREVTSALSDITKGVGSNLPTNAPEITRSFEILTKYSAREKAELEAVRTDPSQIQREIQSLHQASETLLTNPNASREEIDQTVRIKTKQNYHLEQVGHGIHRLVASKTPEQISTLSPDAVDVKQQVDADIDEVVRVDPRFSGLSADKRASVRDQVRRQAFRATQAQGGKGPMEVSSIQQITSGQVFQGLNEAARRERPLPPRTTNPTAGEATDAGGGKGAALKTPAPTQTSAGPGVGEISTSKNISPQTKTTNPSDKGEITGQENTKMQKAEEILKKTPGGKQSAEDIAEIRREHD